VTTLIDLLAPLWFCEDISGFLKHGGSYWHRKRRIDRWKAERQMR